MRNWECIDLKAIHGGDIYRNHVLLDFSVNMNPLGIPESVVEALHSAVDQCGTYPDIHSQELKLEVSKMLGIPENRLIFGNGASELFLAVVHAFKPKKIVIPAPSFYGYEHAAKAVQADISYYYLKEEIEFALTESIFSYFREDVDMLFLATPNNPTGRRVDRRDLNKILTHCRENNIIVVLDECFIEFCVGETENGLSAIDMLSMYENLIVIRAFTKIFTIPGVRLGYLVCENKGFCEKIMRQLPEWNISTFAQKAGAACAKEQAFIRRTQDYLKSEREFLIQGLKNVKDFQCEIYPGEANFLLIYTDQPFYEKLLKKRILVRDCSNFRGLKNGYYRIAVKSRKENEELLNVMEEIAWNE